MIKPTIGRVVWFHPGANDPHKFGPQDQPRAALVSYVWSDRLVNLTVSSPNGETYGATSVVLVQEGDATPKDYYCEWMPFQKGQAAKYDALEAKTKT
jgi:hypothetical protein